jgi:hypothetical protein
MLRENGQTARDLEFSPWWRFKSRSPGLCRRIGITAQKIATWNKLPSFARKYFFCLLFLASDETHATKYTVKFCLGLFANLKHVAVLSTHIPPPQRKQKIFFIALRQNNKYFSTFYFLLRMTKQLLRFDSEISIVQCRILSKSCIENFDSTQKETTGV